MNNDTFIWTDELVKEFTDLWLEKFNTNDFTFNIGVERFKESKQPKKEFEILTRIDPNIMSDINNANVIEECLRASIRHYPIRSVKRLSDNEIISVDDDVIGGKIHSIVVDENYVGGLRFSLKNMTYNICLREVQKSKQSTKLFTRTLEQAKERLGIVQKQEKEFNREISNNNKQIKLLEIKNKKIARKISSHMKYINVLMEEVKQKK